MGTNICLPITAVNNFSHLTKISQILDVIPRIMTMISQIQRRFIEDLGRGLVNFSQAF